MTMQNDFVGRQMFSLNGVKVCWKGQNFLSHILWLLNGYGNVFVGGNLSWFGRTKCYYEYYKLLNGYGNVYCMGKISWVGYGKVFWKDGN